jgi:hemerythrin superfamily protein
LRATGVAGLPFFPAAHSGHAAVNIDASQRMFAHIPAAIRLACWFRSNQPTNPEIAMPSNPQDAIELLTADHEKVKGLFEQFEKLSDRSKVNKKKLADQICLELTVHTQIEEEIFYPAMREASKDDDMVDEAVVEHAAAKDLIAQIREMDPGDDLYDAKVKVLSEQIDHHVGEEEDEMFDKARKTKLDLAALGEEMAMRKDELMATA